MRPRRRAREEKWRFEVGGIERREGKARGELSSAVALSTV